VTDETPKPPTPTAEEIAVNWIGHRDTCDVLRVGGPVRRRKCGCGAAQQRVDIVVAIHDRDAEWAAQIRAALAARDAEWENTLIRRLATEAAELSGLRRAHALALQQRPCAYQCPPDCPLAAPHRDACPDNADRCHNCRERAALEAAVEGR
jgi:hypothetical protein